MLSFSSDYTEGAHPKILDRFIETNLVQVSGYGSDEFCESAKRKIKAALNCEEAQVYFLAGGTQSNLIVASSMLKSYEGVICAETGHIHAHEAGAIEYTGHKTLTVPQYDGKLKTSDVRALLEGFWADENRDHLVFPGMVYISNPTEYGTLYKKSELKKLYALCKEYNIKLFIDGARLGYGLCASDNDITLPDLCGLCDVFYIGGTKVGALCGEAVVFTHNNMPEHFLTITKQHGALLAKGRLLGITFDTLFTDNLYFEISKNAIDKADNLREILRSKGYKFHIETTTNQIFVILENEKMNELRKKVQFGFWENLDKNHTVVRFATSWATTDEQIEEVSKLL